MIAMSVVAHGVDLVDCHRLQEVVDRHGQKFLERVFTPAELAYCRGRKRELEHLAGRFAAKEAVLKVLGTGWRNGIKWTDVEVLNEPSGQPRVRLHDECKRLAQEQGLGEVLVSISHIQTHAIASAIGVSAKAPPRDCEDGSGPDAIP
jgi:holo-[acyl-carrier protein] synthase